MFKKLPNSTRKFIRLEKARIRRQFLDYKTQEEAIVKMYSKILHQPFGHSQTDEVATKSEISEPVQVEKTLPKKQEKQITKKTKTKISKKKKINK